MADDVAVTQAERTAAERFNADLRCSLTGTQVHNLAGLLARHAAAARIEGVRLGIAAAAEWLRAKAATIEDVDRHVDAHLYADAIIALDAATIAKGADNEGGSTP